VSRSGWSWLAFFALLGCAAPAYALDPAKPFSDFARDDWSAEQGLPQITVLSMVQGPEGYLWLGTQGGLARFDGIRFRNFTPEEIPALPGLWVQSMLIDKSGRLWIGTYKGLATYKEGHFDAVTGPFAANTDIRGLAELPDGGIAVSTDNGVGIVRDGVFAVAPGFAGVPAYGLLSYAGALYVGSVDKVYIRGAHGSTAMPLPGAAKGTLVTHLVWHDGALWAGSSDGLFRYSNGNVSRFPLPAPLTGLPVSALRSDSDGTLWVATISGLARIYQGRIVEVVPSGETDGQVEAIFEDREKNLWFGTRANGMFRLWNGFIERLSTQYGLSQPVIWSLAFAPGGGYWVGTSNGLERYQDGRFKLAVPGAALPDPNAYTLLADGDTLWIGTRNGLAIYTGGRLQPPPAALAPLRSVQISGILKTRGGDWWFATTGGAFRYADGVLSRFGPEQGLTEVRCRVLLEARDGRVLVGTVSGLYVYADGRMQRIAELPADLDVPSVAELKDGTFVAGTLTDTGLDETRPRPGPAHQQRLLTVGGQPRVPVGRRLARHLPGAGARAGGRRRRQARHGPRPGRAQRPGRMARQPGGPLLQRRRQRAWTHGRRRPSAALPRGRGAGGHAQAALQRRAAHDGGGIHRVRRPVARARPRPATGAARQVPRPRHPLHRLELPVPGGGDAALPAPGL
jgi:ligand-binding sensor domain-containing protein